MDISEYYSNSFEGFKRNPKLMVPQLVGIILQYLIIGIFVFTLLFWFFGSDLFNILSIILNNGTIPSDFNMPSFDSGFIFILILLFIIVAVIIGLITSFFSAATIGMGKKIIEEGSSDLDFAWECGRKYFIKIFLVSLVIGLLFVALFIPFLLGAFSANGVAAIIGIIISLILLIILFLSVMVANQSIVIGGKGVIEAIRESFDLFWNNKLTVFLVALINGVTSIILGLVLGFILGLIPVIGSTLSNIIISLLLTPFLALVTIYLYLDLKGKDVEETVLETSEVSG